MTKEEQVAKRIRCINGLRKIRGLDEIEKADIDTYVYYVIKKGTTTHYLAVTDDIDWHWEWCLFREGIIRTFTDDNKEGWYHFIFNDEGEFILGDVVENPENIPITDFIVV